MFDFVELTQPQNPQSKKFHVFLYKIGTHFTTIGTPLWPQEILYMILLPSLIIAFIIYEWTYFL